MNKKSDTKEKWKDISGYEGIYRISSLGRVYAYKITKGRKGDFILKQATQTQGYKQVKLYLEDTKKTFYVHRLVATAFINNPNNKKFVNHKDGNKANNIETNLEWCTKSENTIHSYRELGRISLWKGSKHRAGIPSKFRKPVLKISIEGEILKEYECGRHVEKDGFCYKCVSQVCLGKCRKHKGFIWKFKNK